jgi:Transcription factor WhiB
MTSQNVAVMDPDRLATYPQLAPQEPACRKVDPEIFFGPADSPEKGRPTHAWERRALAVCASCPLLAACRTMALDFPAAEQYGVLGGMTAGQRRAALRRSRRVRDDQRGRSRTVTVPLSRLLT